MQKITPFLWFDDQAEKAIAFYLNVFKTGRIISVHRRLGKVFTGTFELFGQQYHFINGGPMFRFSEAISLMVMCEDQKEIDSYWGGLLEGGGTEQMCGWLKDRYGLSWQIVPSNLGALLNSEDRAKAERAGAALMKMRKIDIAALEQA